MGSVDILDSVISALDSVSNLKYIKTEENVLDLKGVTKRLYDFTKTEFCRKSDALPELITEDFDEEQIWQQLELQNECELSYFSVGISKVLANNKKLIVPISSTKPEPIPPKNDNLNEEDEDVSDDKESEDEDVSDDKELEDEDAKTRGILKKRKHDTKKKKKKSSIVDDKFFRLQELDEYLTKEDKKERQGRYDTGSDDESVDLFNDFSEEEIDDNTRGKYLKYIDFFDSPASERSEEEESDNEGKESNSEDEEMGDDEEEEEEEYESSSKKVKFNLTNDSDETDSLERKEDEKQDTGPKSSFEVRQEKLQTIIKNLEDKLIGEKPWYRKGEISCSNRSQNSLMEEFLKFDVTTRPAPVITEETTMKLEDLIKQRIKDKAWDDVEKKFKPVETPLEYKKKLVMDQEKSKESLSQIYEKEYMKQKQALNSDEEKEVSMPELHHEIRRGMRSLFAKLDALSNYHYTPKQVKPEIRIVSNVPAVNMEEVAPVATSDAAMLAPEEIKAKPRGDVVGKSERTKTDKKRERRRKKMRQRAKQKVTEEKEKLRALKPGVGKKYKKDNAALVKKLTKDRNITKSEETGKKAPKSSTAFFTQLQDQVKSQIKAKVGSASKKKDKNALSAVKLKL